MVKKPGVLKYIMTLNDVFSSVQNHDDQTINLLLVMILIWVSGVVFRKMRQPPMLGELLGGFIFGPSVLGIISPDAIIDCLAELARILHEGSVFSS